MVTVRELREQLTELPDDLDVILQKDPEGNGYSRAVGAEIAYTQKGVQRAWDMEVRSAKCIEESGEDIGDFKQCVVVWPT